MRLAVGTLFVLCSLGSLLAQPVCTFVGDALPLGGDCYQITDNNEWELGAVWFNDQLDLTQPFTINVDVELGSADETGADGIVFVMQSLGPAAIGVAGGGLGFEGFNPSFGVEIDTWQNVDVGDPVADHVAFLRDGINLHTAPYFNLAGPVSARLDGANIEDGQPHQFKLEWDPVLQIMRFYFDCEQRLVLQEDIVGEIFNGQSDVWWGFTGSTGGSSNQQSVCITSSAVGLPPEHALCEGEAVELILEAAEEGTVSWDPVEGLSSPNSSSTMASPDGSTLYTATWTDVCGETLTEETWVEVEALPEPDLQDSLSLCSGEDGQLTAQVPVDVADITWTDGTLTADWTGSQTGWLGVTVESAAGCVGTDSTLVVGLFPEELDFFSVETLCTGQDTLLPWPDGGGEWTVNGVAMPDGWLAQPGDAALTYVDSATGCPMDTLFSMDEIVIEPTVLAPGFEVCEGESLTLELTCDPASSVSWSPEEGLSDPMAVQPELTPSESGVYTATIADQCGGTAAHSTEVQVVPLPTPELPDSITLCPGDVAELSLTTELGVPDPVWTDGTTGWTWQGDAAGWQAVALAPLPGCTGADSTWITNAEAAAPVFQADPLCPGDFAFIPFPAGWTDWTVDGTGESAGGVTVMEPGNYVVQAATEDEGCPVVAQLIVPSGALPDLGLPEVVEFCPEQVVSLNLAVPGPVYWSDGVEGTSRQLNQPGTYTASYSTDCGTVTGEVNLVEIPCGCTVFAPSAFTPDGDLINDAWRPSFDCDVEEYSLKIYNRWGALVWETNNPEEFWTGGYREDGRPLEEKLYFVRDGLYTFLLTFRDPTFRVRTVERVTGHIQIIR